MIPRLIYKKTMVQVRFEEFEQRIEKYILWNEFEDAYLVSKYGEYRPILEVVNKKDFMSEIENTVFWVMQGPSGRILIETISPSKWQAEEKFGGEENHDWKAIQVNIIAAMGAGIGPCYLSS